MWSLQLECSQSDLKMFKTAVLPSWRCSWLPEKELLADSSKTMIHEEEKGLFPIQRHEVISLIHIK